MDRIKDQKPLVLIACAAAVVLLVIVVFRTVKGSSSATYSAELSKEMPTPQPGARVFGRDPNDTPTIDRAQIQQLQVQQIKKPGKAK